MNKEFASQYKHPNWQKKRLEALEFYGFECQHCQDKDSMLHVHHKRYVKGRKVWEYEVDELEVLCEPCHDAAHAIKDQVSELVALMSGIEMDDFLQVLKGYTRADTGPRFEDEMLASNTPDWYLAGIMAQATPFLNQENKLPVFDAFLAAIKAQSPKASGYHALVEAMIAKARAR